MCPWYNYSLLPLRNRLSLNDSFLSEKQLLCFGDGANKAKEVVKHSNFILVSDIYPSAQDMADLAEKAFTNKKFEDTAYFEPFYLKDFVATIPKKNIYS